jgi:hypothetical protein
MERDRRIAWVNLLQQKLIIVRPTTKGQRIESCLKAEVVIEPLAENNRHFLGFIAGLMAQYSPISGAVCQGSHPNFFVRGTTYFIGVFKLRKPVHLLDTGSTTPPHGEYIIRNLP